MTLFVLKCASSSIQTKLVSSYRNGRPRVIAFEKSIDARQAVPILKRNPRYHQSEFKVCKVNGARLTKDFGAADIGLDFCIVIDQGGDANELGISKSVLLKKSMQEDVTNVRAAKKRLERDFAITESCM